MRAMYSLKHCGMTSLGRTCIPTESEKMDCANHPTLTAVYNAPQLKHKLPDRRPTWMSIRIPVSTDVSRANARSKERLTAYLR